MKKINCNKILKISINIILGLTIFLIMDVFFYLQNLREYVSDIDIYFIKFSFFISIIIFSMFWVLLKRSYKALTVGYILIFFIGIINQIKYMVTSEPLYLTDVTFISKIPSLIGLVTTNISKETIISVVKMCFIYIIVLGIFDNIAYLFDLEITSNKKIKSVIIFFDIIVILVLFLPLPFTKNILLSTFIKNDAIQDYNSYGTNFHYYMKYGITAGMYGNYLNNIFTKPKEYNEKNLEEILSEDNKNDYKNSIEKPNIIVISSESFWDINNIEEVKFDKNVLENFYNLKNEGYLVDMISPSYGGMSEHAMFELVTGGTLHYFEPGYIPISFLYNRRNSVNAPSLIKILNQNNYYTQTTFVEDYYNTKKSYSKIGFKKYSELIKDEKKSPSYYSDEVLTDIIIRDIKKQKENFFGVYSTYEGHMPYNKNKFVNYDIKILESSLFSDEEETILAYAQGLYDADKALGKLYKYISGIDEKTLIIFFGDHLPYLRTPKYYNLYHRLNYFNTDDTLTYLYRMYNTQALILANFEIDDLEIPKYSGYSSLLVHILNKLGIETSNYYRWIDKTSEILPAYNKYVAIDQNGNLYYTNELEGEMKRIRDLRDDFMYKLFIDTK